MKRIATFPILTTAALLSIAANAEIFTEGKQVSAMTEELKPGDFVWEPERSAAEPVLIVVSKPEQMAYVYRSTLVFTGKPVNTETQSGPKFKILGLGEVAAR